MNRTLLEMLWSLPETHKTHWKDHLHTLVNTYNCTRRDATGYFPFFLLFGRSPRLPIDLVFNLNMKPESTDHLRYVAKTAMQETYTKASTKANINKQCGKKHYDSKVRSSVSEPGDRVLVRNLPQRGGPGKSRFFWEEVYLAVSRKAPHSPVYEVQHKSKSRTLHYVASVRSSIT